MNEVLYTVRVDGTDRKIKKGTTYREIARAYQAEYPHDIVLVFVDGRLQELFKTLEKDCELRFVTTADPLGYKSYRRSMSLMLQSSFMMWQSTRISIKSEFIIL